MKTLLKDFAEESVMCIAAFSCGYVLDYYYIAKFGFRTFRYDWWVYVIIYLVLNLIYYIYYYIKNKPARDKFLFQQRFCTKYNITLEGDDDHLFNQFKAISTNVNNPIEDIEHANEMIKKYCNK